MRSAIALILANIIWGAAPPIFKFAYQSVPPFTLGLFRFAIAIALLLPFIGHIRYEKVHLRQWTIVLIGAVLSAVHVLLLFEGLKHTQSINTSIISATGPVFLYFASVKLLHERKNPRVLIGMCIALIGSLFVIISPLLTGEGGLSSEAYWGNVLIFMSTMANMASILFLKKSLSELSPLFVTFVMFAVTALAFYPLSIQELQTWSVGQLDYRGVFGILFGAVFSSTLAYYLHDYGIAKHKAEEVEIFSYVGPVVTVMIAVPLLGEVPSTMYYAGAVVVGIGILIAEGKLHWHSMHELRRQNEPS